MLYALSTYMGLTVVDMGDPTNLRVVGRHRSAATPFEMYLDGEQLFVMYNGFYSYVHDEAAGATTWRSTARLQALDISDPSRIRLLGDYPITGEISDSRLVGDVLYLVTFENGWCWSCEEGRQTTRVASFDVADATTFEKVDELAFENPDQDNTWGKRSIHVTTERMYVAGPTWSQGEGSVIQVVDISDPKGSLSLGAEIPTDGSIDNRWQMDEHAGVLRVVGQPGGWNSGQPPIVETFEMASTDVAAPLGRLEMVLPRPEELQSVRFDAERAYVITFERTDPLFTLDMSDPADPQQMGELEIPGWVYHMEPRGDRVYGLGFDRDSDEGSQT